MAPEKWFDAHLDLAYLAMQGRPMHQPLSKVQAYSPGASVSISSLVSGRVKTLLATIFVQPWDSQSSVTNGPWCYKSLQDAHDLAKAQIDIYDRWIADGLLCGQNQGEESTAPVAKLLMEGCDPILEIDDLNFFYHRGVRAISLTWIDANRWAGGNNSQMGLSHDGEKLLQRAADLGMVLDVSHLSEQAFDAVIDLYPGVIIASHSNCRDLLPAALQTPRNLSNAQIRRLMKREGVMGINLYSKFLTAGRATLDDVVRHVMHAADIAGTMKQVGLGSDMDGGFDASALPVGLISHEDLPNLSDALSQAGLSDDDINRFAYQNWHDKLDSVCF